MNDSALLLREPVVNRNQEIIGYDLRMSAGNGLLRFLKGEREDQDFFARLPNRFAFAPSSYLDAASGAASAGRMVLAVDATQTSAEELLAHTRKWKGAGFGVCLENPESHNYSAESLDLATHVRLGTKEASGTLEKICNRLRKHNAKQIVSGITSNKLYEVSARAGCDLFQGYYFTEPTQDQAAVVNPSYTSIVTLMKLVQENAPVQKIEEALKRDAALSFKLLRYINSAGFGLSCEIQSFRHAVAVLGYQNLYKWLSLLLVTAARQSASAALVTTSITRGRLAELIAESFFDAQERDNLFIVGAFSLLHIILRMPLEQLAEQIALSENITDALVRHEGPYGPFLELTELSENLADAKQRTRALELAASLGLPSEALNQAQIAALTWAESLGR